MLKPHNKFGTTIYNTAAHLPQLTSLCQLPKVTQTTHGLCACKWSLSTVAAQTSSNTWHSQNSDQRHILNDFYTNTFATGSSNHIFSAFAQPTICQAILGVQAAVLNLFSTHFSGFAAVKLHCTRWIRSAVKDIAHHFAKHVLMNVPSQNASHPIRVTKVFRKAENSSSQTHAHVHLMPSPA